MQERKISGASEAICHSAWKNCYWFARMLINTDQYAAPGKNERFMNALLSKVEPLIMIDSFSKEDTYKICRDALFEELGKLSEGESKTALLRKYFCQDIDEMITSLEDIEVFLFTVRYIVLPSNSAITNIPNHDSQFCREQADQILHSLGKKAAGKVIALWDTVGERICLAIEREEITAQFTRLRAVLENLNNFPRSSIEDNAVLTAFVQEFERRAAQKRKPRAGKSLEDAVKFLFEFYGLKSHPKPEHFQTDIEVDKWFKCKDGWTVGISCKRTLRERWKQVSSADYDTLSRLRIREIWHLITYDRDLSDDKITMLGAQRHIFYLDDTSERYITASEHPGMKNYVRPINRLIDDIISAQT